jgi:hypothetical protein
MLRLVREMNNRGASVQFIKENINFTAGNDDSRSTLMFTMLSAFAQFERSLIKERQREGVALAKAKGIYKGRKPALNAERIAQLREQAATGANRTKLAKEFGISRETLYQYIRSLFCSFTAFRTTLKIGFGTFIFPILSRNLHWPPVACGWTTWLTIMVSARASTWARSKIICSRIQKAGVLPMDFDSLTAISGDIPAFSLMRLDRVGRDTFNALAAAVTLKSSSSIVLFTIRSG